MEHSLAPPKETGGLGVVGSNPAAPTKLLTRPTGSLSRQYVFGLRANTNTVDGDRMCGPSVV